MFIGIIRIISIIDKSTDNEHLEYKYTWDLNCYALERQYNLGTDTF